MKDLHVEQVETLYSHHHGWLRGWLRGKLGCTEQAADLAHDTFLRILGKRDVLSALNEPRAYLVTTAKHLLIDRARRQRIELAYLEQLGLQQEDMRDMLYAPSPDAVLQAVEAIESLGKALRGLRSEMAEVFILHYVQGRPQEDLAVHFRVSLRTVQTWLAQALIQCHRTFAV